MSVDPSQAIEPFARQEGVTRRRRRRHNHRGLKHHSNNRRVQRVLTLVFLGLVVILASLYFAQRYAAYQPPAPISD